MKIALVQINPIIGDFAHNSRKIYDACCAALKEGCKLIIFPELALSGYPPYDLLERPAYLAAHDQALLELCSKLPDIDLLIGCIERRITESGGKKLYNSGFLSNGVLLCNGSKSNYCPPMMSLMKNAGSNREIRLLLLNVAVCISG